MKRIFAPFTRNWWLKLIALILALAVFYGVRSSLHGTQYGMQTRIFASPSAPSPATVPAPSPAPSPDPAPAEKVTGNADPAK